MALDVTETTAKIASPKPQHIVGYVLFSDHLAIRLVRRTLLVLACLRGLFYLIAATGWLFWPLSFQKDFLQLFVLAHALVEGVPPYQHMEVLIRQYIGVTSHLFPHPTPHPLTQGLLFVVVGLMDYQTAMTGWFALEVVGFVTAVVLTARAYALPVHPAITAAVAIGSLSWWPMLLELRWLNVNAVLAAVLAGGILATSTRRTALAGVLFGFSFLVKPVFWPVAFVLVLRREWRALTGAITCSGIGYALAVVAAGPSTILDYFYQVLPDNTRLYATSPWNFSLYGLGEKLRRGIGAVDAIPSQHWWLTSVPIIDSLAASALLALAPTVLVLVWLAVVTLRSNASTEPLGFAVCVSILVSPIVWGHYFVALVIPITAIVASLSHRQFALCVTNVALLVGGLLLVNQFDWISLTYSAAGIEPVVTKIGHLVLPGPPAVIPAIPSLIITMGPLLAVFGLSLIMSHICLSRPKV